MHAKENGLSGEEAQLIGRIQQSRAIRAYENTGVLPSEWIKTHAINIRRENGELSVEGEGFSQAAAAMYRNPRKDIAEFVEFAKSRQEKKQSYFEYNTADGDTITIPTDTALHDANKHETTTKEDWQRLLDNFNNSQAREPKRQDPKYNGHVILGTFTADGSNYGYTAEVFASGKTLITTFFKDKKSVINNWIKQKAANAPQNSPLKPLPLKQAIISRLGNNLVGQPNNSITQEGQNVNRDITQTAAFKKWFGDWENDPQNASKVVDGEGKPLVVYHNTAKSFNEFDLSKARQNSDIPAFFFSAERGEWADMGNIEMPVYLSIKKPYTENYIDYKGLGRDFKAIRRELIKDGYDGIMIEEDGRIPEYIAFHAEQIKSIDNRGTFDGDNANIYYQSKNNKDRTQEILKAFSDIAAGAQEATIKDLRDDIAQYGGSNDIAFIYGDEKKGLYHIAQKHGLDTLSKVIDAVINGKIDRFVEGNKTLHIVKDGYDAVLSLDENGQRKTWLLTGFEINNKTAGEKGEVSTPSDSTQIKPTFSRQDLVAAVINSIAHNGQDVNRFEQTNDREPRGSVRFTPEGAILDLLRNADKSTPIHETLGHIYLRDFEEYATLARENGWADENSADDWQKITDYLGAPQNIGGQLRFTEKQHEKFAKAAETYIMTNEAPSAAMKPLFERFKEWLLEIYGSIKGLVELTPEIEQVFERLFAEQGDTSFDVSEFEGKEKDVEAAVKEIEEGRGAATINGIGLKEIKSMLRTLETRRPREPKTAREYIKEQGGIKILALRRGQTTDISGGEAAKWDDKSLINNESGLTPQEMAERLAAAGYTAGEEGGTIDADSLYKIDLNGFAENDPQTAAQLEKIERYDNNIDFIERALGGRVRAADSILRNIAALEAAGYRVVGNADIEAAEEAASELDTLAQTQAKLEEKVSKLTLENDELRKTAERRLAETARLDRERTKEAYGEAFKDAANHKTMTALKEAEEAAYKNKLNARRVKNALIKEIEKRELENKEELLKAYDETEEGSKDVGLAARNLRTYGAAQLERMFAMLSEQDKKLADIMIRLAGASREAQNRAHKRIYGFAMPTIEGVYFPSAPSRNAGGRGNIPVRRKVQQKTNRPAISRAKAG